MTVQRSFSCSKDVQLVHTSGGTDGGVGAGNVISVGQTPGGSRTRTELEFQNDFGGLVEITRAYLRLKVTNNCGAIGSAVKCYAEQITSEFKEGKYADTCGVGADNAEKWPGVYNSNHSTTNRGVYSGTPADGDLVSIEITALMQSILESGDAQTRLALIASDGAGGYDESNANRYCGFWSREKGNDGQGYRPRIEVVGNDSHSPNAPLDVSPTTTNYQAASEAATRVERTFKIKWRFSDDDLPSADTPGARGDHMTASEVQFFPATATDDGAGNVTGGSLLPGITGDGVAVYLDATGKPITGLLDGERIVTAPASLVGTEIRGRVRTKDSRGLWGDWTPLAAMRLIPVDDPTAPTNLSLNTALPKPVYHGHHNDPNGAPLKGVETQVVVQTSAGIAVIENATSHQLGDPSGNNPYSTVNGTGMDVVTGGTSFSVEHSGRNLRVGERPRRRHRTVNVWGAVGDWCDWQMWVVGQASAPTVTPDSDTKQDTLTPNLGARYTEAFDRLYIEAYAAKDLASTQLWASGAVTVSGTSAAIEYGSVGSAADLVWGQPLWVRTRVRVAATASLSAWSDLSFVWTNALPTAPPISIDGAVRGTDGIWRVPTLTPRINLPYADDDLPNDTPTRQVAKLYLVPVGATPVFSSDLTSGIAEYVDVPASAGLAWETRYQVQGRYADSSEVLGPITYLQVKTHRPPSVAVGTAPDVHDPRPAINWTATFYGIAGQKGYQVVVYDVTDAADPLLVLDSGFIEDDAADSYQVDPYVLESGHSYQATVYITDTEGETSVLDANPFVFGSATSFWEMVTTATATVVDASASLPADAFGRTVAVGWGTADSGQAYELFGTSAAYAVAGGVGTITLSTPGDVRRAHLTAALIGDITLLAKVKTNKLAVGGVMWAGIHGRAVTLTDFIAAELRFNTDQTIDLLISKVVGGTRTVIQTYRTAETHVAGTYYWVRLQVFNYNASGSTFISINARAWQEGSGEPGAWHVSDAIVSAVLKVPSGAGLSARAATGITNAPVVGSFDALSSTSP